MKTKTCLWSSLGFALALASSASQITNSVDIAAKVVFNLIKPEDARPLSQINSDEVVDFCIGSSGTNVLYLRKFPYGNFEFHLFNEKGEEMPKTQLALNLTRTPPKPKKDDLRGWRTSNFAPFMVGGGATYFAPLFRPDDMFVITNMGAYELEVRARLCLIMTNGLPDLKAMVSGANATAFTNHFDVFTSLPLRVKVIKK